jgi:hypothetical protein
MIRVGASAGTATSSSSDPWIAGPTTKPFFALVVDRRDTERVDPRVLDVGHGDAVLER